jgi:hypothetical protein
MAENRLRIPLILGMIILISGCAQSPFMCTKIGCSDTLKLVLSREPAQEYTILVTSNTREAHQATCTSGKVGYDQSSKLPILCNNGSVSFMGFSPEEVNVTLAWDGGSYSTTGRPVYEAFKPNGRFCPPTCQTGLLQMTVP